MKLRLTVLVLTLLLPLSAAAQDEAARYLREAGGDALLYRGHKAYSYPMTFNGTYFWEGPAFRQGEALYNGKKYAGLMLNVDAARQDLIVKTPSGAADKVLARGLGERFTLDGILFLNLEKVYGPDSPSGFWEVLHDGKAKVVRQVRRILRQDLDGTLRMQMGYDISTYRNNVHNTFIIETAVCYIDEAGRIYPVRRRSQLMKLYKDHKREINRYIGSLEANSRLELADFCKAVVDYAETL